MFIAALFINRNMEISHCPSINERVIKVWYVCTREYYSNIKMNKVLSDATTLMSLILDEKTRCKRPSILCFHLYQIPPIGKSVETESRLLTLGVMEGKVGLTANGCEVHLGGD